MVATSWPDRLRTAGLRVTQQRLAVLHVVHADPHIAADQVAERVRSDLGAVSTQAIYDTLNTLTDHGILRRFEPAGSSMRFETANGDNHHHLVCRHCGRVNDVACSVGSHSLRGARRHPGLRRRRSGGDVLGALPLVRRPGRFGTPQINLIRDQHQSFVAIHH